MPRLWDRELPLGSGNDWSLTGVLTGVLPDGWAGRATPLRGESYCRWHSPDHVAEAAEARKLGCLRRRREKTITTAYDLDGLGSVDGIRRVLDFAVADALALENSIARSRVLIAAAMAATRLFEVAENETREALLASDLALFRGEGE